MDTRYWNTRDHHILIKNRRGGYTPRTEYEVKCEDCKWRARSFYSRTEATRRAWEMHIRSYDYLTMTTFLPTLYAGRWYGRGEYGSLWIEDIDSLDPARIKSTKYQSWNSKTTHLEMAQQDMQRMRKRINQNQPWYSEVKPHALLMGKTDKLGNSDKPNYLGQYFTAEAAQRRAQNILEDKALLRFKISTTPPARKFRQQPPTIPDLIHSLVNQARRNDTKTLTTVLRNIQEGRNALPMLDHLEESIIARLTGKEVPDEVVSENVPTP